MNLLAFFRKHSDDDKVQDVLMAHADALISGDLNRDTLRAQYDSMVNEQVDALLDLAERVQRTMTTVSPSEQFVIQLGRELAMGNAEGSQSLVERVRNMPPRMQLAAGIGGATLTAGLVLLASRAMPDALEFWRNRRTATA